MQAGNPTTSFTLTRLGTALLLAGGFAAGTPAWADEFTDAITGGKAKLDLRLRYESVQQDNALKDADALTLRTRLGYETGAFHGFRIYGEFENVAALNDSYSPETTGYSVVADPSGSEVNQIYLAYKGLPGTEAIFGRQRIIYDNARFVGNVGWRQNEQTYDGFRLVNTSLPDTTLNYAYLYNVDTFTATKLDIAAHLVNATYAGLPFGKLTGYGYFLDFPAAPTTSNKTLGLRFVGDTVFGGVKLSYLAEVAKQTDYKGGNNGIDADYRALELGASLSGVTVKLGYELLGADAFSGFETPLATKHAFNGWADVFLNTPTTGLEDKYVSVGGKVMGVALAAVYHDFTADTGGADYGTEWDLQATTTFAKHYNAGIKYASYNADTFSVDTDKTWVWVGLSF